MNLSVHTAVRYRYHHTILFTIDLLYGSAPQLTLMEAGSLFPYMCGFPTVDTVGALDSQRGISLQACPF